MALPHLQSIIHQTPLHSLHLHPPHRPAFFISAYDQSTGKRHFLSAPRDDRPVTHLMTLDKTRAIGTTQTQHLNGLVCFTFVSWYYAQAYVMNPSTHDIFKLPDPDYGYGKVHICYVFGLDELTNEHKVLHIRRHDARSPEPWKCSKVEIVIYSMSSHSWRKIDVEPPSGFSWDRLDYEMSKSVCINSVVHLLLRESFDVLAFDLRTEKFSIISTPEDVVPRTLSSLCTRNGKTTVKINKPFIIKINGCVGVVCHDRVLEIKQRNSYLDITRL